MKEKSDESLFRGGVLVLDTQPILGHVIQQAYVMNNKAQLTPGVSVECVTPGAGHYFFGYYDKCPWDQSGRLILAMRGRFMDRRPLPDDTLEIGWVDPEKGCSFEVIGETSAWCWQQGCMLQWLPSGEILYNTRQGDGFVAVIFDPGTGHMRTLPRAIYAVDPRGEKALCLNFSRLQDKRPGYGYAGVEDPWRDVLAPDDDGIHIMDMATGQSELRISLAEVASSLPEDQGKQGPHWFNHLQFTPDGSRFVFLHRRMEPGSGRRTRMFTASRDGSQLFLLCDSGAVSHFDWYDNTQILAWAQYGEEKGYFLFKDGAGSAEWIGEGVLAEDGHCSYSPDRQWLMVDTYPDADGMKTLTIYHLSERRRVDIGRFYGPKPADNSCRCDLHPRWSRCGRKICIDSIHEGGRKIYTLDISSLLESP